MIGASASRVTTPLTLSHPGYDVPRDIAPISRLVSITPMLVAHEAPGQAGQQGRGVPLERIECAFCTEHDV